MGSIHHILQDVKKWPKLLIIQKIREKCKEQFGYFPDSPSRTRSAKRSRWAAAVLMYNLTDTSYKEIAEFLGFADRSGAMKATRLAHSVGRKEGWWDQVVRIEKEILEEIFAREIPAKEE